MVYAEKHQIATAGCIWYLPDSLSTMQRENIPLCVRSGESSSRREFLLGGARITNITRCGI